MSFTLHVDGPAWRDHLRHTIATYQEHKISVLPVIKGNGYGFGRGTLLKESAALGFDAVAVGTIFEARDALDGWDGTLVVLEPFLPSDLAAAQIWRDLTRGHAHRLVATVAGDYLKHAHEAGVSRVRLEGATSMHRFGLQPHDIDQMLTHVPDGIVIESLTIHLPIAEPDIKHVAALETPGRASTTTGWILETVGWLMNYASISTERGLPLHVSSSHVSASDAGHVMQYAAMHPSLELEIRIGTALWLGAPHTLKASGTVLEIHEAGMGHTRAGYTQVDTHGHARIAVVSGGTSHGVALAAPSSPTSLRRRAVAVAEGIKEAMGSVRSPFRIGNEHLIFAEPPHMHVSMLWCEDRSLSVGDEVECRVRNTTATFDAVLGL